MIRERILSGRQSGKTTYLIERVQQAQDEGADMVLVITHNTREAQRWADNVLEWEIDPSRFMVFSAHNIAMWSRGRNVDVVFVDNADLVPYEDLKYIEQVYSIDVATYSTG